ncbi:uncharacterized protein LOC120013466 isoform X5 [Tripterygium wilfordii]|uniref:uncharacterized protein LOC120013466 isoform X5 n=1 Tax=Tripterygium wilfordii TaxID=458696 RepID=UPI0018F82021|nr:uncharacterized protein LOC120013466 isoform X5 [Tripterygium wilfordii]
MAKRRAKKTVKEAAASSPALNENCGHVKATQIEDKEAAILVQDVERRIGAVRAMRDVEIEHSLTALHLLRSYFTKTSLFGADNLKFRDFLMEDPSDYQMPGMHSGLKTPGVSSQRLSIGMTPKTLRVPKPGEMLLSVHGSPLGVYKDDNMEAIHGEEWMPFLCCLVRKNRR